jgi:hypothetical protein
MEKEKLQINRKALKCDFYCKRNHQKLFSSINQIIEHQSITYNYYECKKYKSSNKIISKTKDFMAFVLLIISGVSGEIRCFICTWKPAKDRAF